MLPVKSMWNSLFFVDRVEDVISVLLYCSGKDDYFEVFGHLIQEFMAVWANKEDAFWVLELFCMNEGFIHVQDEGIFGFFFERGEEGGFGFVGHLVDWTCENAVERDEHQWHFSNFINEFRFRIVQNLEDKRLQGLEPTVDDYGPDYFRNRGIIFGN